MIDSLDELVDRVSDLIVGYFQACRDLQEHAPILVRNAIAANQTIVAEVRMVLESDKPNAAQRRPIFELPIAVSV